MVTTVSLKSVSLGASGSKTIKVKFDFPSTLSTGNYDLIATLQATDTATEPAQATSSTPVTIIAPTVDLATSIRQRHADYRPSR